MNFNLNEIPKDDDAFKKISIYVKALLNKGGKGENWAKILQGGYGYVEKSSSFSGRGWDEVFAIYEIYLEEDSFIEAHKASKDDTKFLIDFLDSITPSGAGGYYIHDVRFIPDSNLSKMEKENTNMDLSIYT